MRGLVVFVLALMSFSVMAEPVETPYGEVSLPFELHQVPKAPVYYIIGKSGVPDSVNEGHTSNGGFVVTDEGVVVFDALGTPALGYRLLQRIREVTDKPVTHVVISHYHADHIYGLQAFDEHAGSPEVIAHDLARGYVGGDGASQGEAGQQRLEQRREALFPWVDENTYLVPPDTTFEKDYTFEQGGLTFEVRHMGPAHAPGDSIMLVREHGVLFSGDVIYKGRIPFLDSPDTDVERWLAGLDYLDQVAPTPRFIIPGHGEASDDVHEAIRFTQGYLKYMRDKMGAATRNFVPFDEAYDTTDWSEYEDMPAFDASNRRNAYRIYLEMEAGAFE